MRNFFSAVIYVLLMVVVVFYTIIEGPPWNRTTAAELVDVSSMLVSVATVTSLVFGMITYLESNVLQGRLSDLQRKLSEVERGFTKSIAQTAETGKQANFEVALTGITALWDLIFVLSEAEEDEGALKRRSRNVSLQEARLHLAHGSPKSVETAIQILFKQDWKQLLECESRVVELGRDWSREDRVKILESYRHLKRRVLDGMIRVE